VKNSLQFVIRYMIIILAHFDSHELLLEDLFNLCI